MAIHKNAGGYHTPCMQYGGGWAGFLMWFCILTQLLMNPWIKLVSFHEGKILKLIYNHDIKLFLDYRNFLYQHLSKPLFYLVQFKSCLPAIQ